MTPPPRCCSVFGGTPPRKRPAPHPCPSGRTKTAPLPAGRRFPFASMPDALHPPRPDYGIFTERQKGTGKSGSPAVFMPPITPARRMFPSCFPFVSCLTQPRTARISRPVWSFPRAGARGRSGKSGAPQTAGFSAPQTVLRLRKNYGKPGRRTALYLRFEVKGRMPAGPFRAFRKRPPGRPARNEERARFSLKTAGVLSVIFP